MKSYKKVLLALAVVCLASTPVLAKRFGDSGFTGHKGQGGMRIETLKVALDLTEQQQAEIQQIVNEQRENSQPLREEMQTRREAIRETLDQEILDEEKLAILMQEQSKLRTEMMIHKHGTRGKITQILTPEQRLKHEELRKTRKEHRGHKKFARRMQRVH